MSDSKSTEELRSNVENLELLRRLPIGTVKHPRDAVMLLRHLLDKEDIDNLLRLFSKHLDKERKRWLAVSRTKPASPLAKLRKSNGLTQQEVADKIGMLRSGYAMVELGKANILANKIPELSRLFGVSTDELLKVMYENEPYSALPEYGGGAKDE